MRLHWLVLDPGAETKLQLLLPELLKTMRRSTNFNVLFLFFYISS